MPKKYDLLVKVGSYEVNGETKNRYENIGAVLENEKGPYIMLKKTFNPAGVETEPGRDSIFVSMFEPKPRQSPSQGFQNTSQEPPPF
ncbi:unnamed protein product [marine sediment metagenome]|uniref:Uncharacterized protein n=1 Tax=marine sediment metagenome TaxID=412755 RepID=X0T7P2_9ZZZZ